MSSSLQVKASPEIDSALLNHVASSEQFNSLPIIAADAYAYLRSNKETTNCSRYIFIRHGESTSNVEKSIAGRTQDVDLSIKGKDQAIKAGINLADTEITINAIYSSPSLRAKNTASLVHVREIETDERLYEKFYGPYEGASDEEYTPVKESEEVDNSGSDKLFSDKFKFKAHPEMESIAEIYVRVAQFLREKHLNHEGHNVIVATHNGVMKSLFIAHAAELGFDVDYRSFILDNAAVLIVEVEKSSIRVKAAHGLTYK